MIHSVVRALVLGLLVPRRLVWSLVIGGEVLQKACSTFEIEARAGIFLRRIHGGSQQLLHRSLGPLELALQLSVRLVGPLAVGMEILKKAAPFFEIEVFAEIFHRGIHSGGLRVNE